jgi:hypothetical protein
VAQGIDPEFKPQYYKRKKKTHKQREITSDHSTYPERTPLEHLKEPHPLCHTFIHSLDE